MASSSLNRHYHTHTKKLCHPPPVYAYPPPACWPPAIPGEVESGIYFDPSTPECMHWEVYVAEKTFSSDAHCTYKFGWPVLKYPSHMIQFDMWPILGTIDIWVGLNCNVYSTKHDYVHGFSLHPGWSPHRFDLKPEDWARPFPQIIVHRFHFTI